MSALLGGAVNCRLLALGAGMELLRSTSGYIISGPALVDVLRQASLGILVATVCFQFSITIGNGCCCSPSKVLQPLRTLLSAIKLLCSHVRVVLKFLI